MNRHNPPFDDQPNIRLGVSACLLGEQVRFDGGHKRDLFLLKTLGRFVEWVPVCPEVEMGLGTPRETLRLAGSLDVPRLVAPKSGTDHTAAMQIWARERLEQLAILNLHGYVLKKNSPSCGLFRVKVYGKNDMPQRKGRGLFARALVDHLPLLPVEEEGRLHDMRLRENFIERVFVYQRWLEVLHDDPTSAGLVRFHTAHKLTLMAHSPEGLRRLGQLAAQAGSLAWDKLTTQYGELLMETLQHLSTTGKNANVLYHLMGYFKDHLAAGEKKELTETITDYRRGLVPLIVPLTLLKHYVRRHPVPDWVHQQVYLNPYPKELMLRNHV
ncbi:MAG: YbgA family protein [Anaerolineae bacterium]